MFNSRHGLQDSLNHFGIGHFSTTFQGKSLECSRGPVHEKKKEEDKRRREATEDDLGDICKKNVEKGLHPLKLDVLTISIFNPQYDRMLLVL